MALLNVVLYRISDYENQGYSEALYILGNKKSVSASTWVLPM